MKKRLLSLVLCVGLVLGLAGCGSSPAAAEDTLPQIIIGSDDYKPYNYVDEDGNAAGIDVELAKEAWHAGADYLGVGDVFGTTTKSDTRQISLEELKEIRDAVEIPVVAIGGVNEENIGLLKKTGVDGAAVISAVVGQKDITAAAERLISNFREA